MKNHRHSLMKKISAMTSISLLMLLTVIPVPSVGSTLYLGPGLPVAEPPVVRGVAGDLWADTILGDPNFSTIAPNTVTADKMFLSQGTIYDRDHNIVYAYDSGNSRIVGVDLTSCPGPSPCSGSIFIGQSNGTTAGCNRDSGFQDFPRRAVPGPDTLCLQPDTVMSLDEVGSGASLALDTGQYHAGDLYVADYFNSRVLKFTYPIHTGDAATAVWGQDDFYGTGCNKSTLAPDFTQPLTDTLCFDWGHSNNDIAGVDLDPWGNLWVVDTGNNRVLRYPRVGNQPTHLPDLEFGQPVQPGISPFTTRLRGSGLNQLSDPSVVRVDFHQADLSTPDSAWVYVTDQHDGRNRILVYKPQPASKGTSRFGNGQNGEEFKPNNGGSPTFNAPTGIDFDPARPGVWINDTGNLRVGRWLTETGTLLTPAQYINYPACNYMYYPAGSIGIANPPPTSGEGDIFIPNAGGGDSGFRNSIRRVTPQQLPNTGCTLTHEVIAPSYPLIGNSQTNSGITTATGIAVYDSQSDHQVIVADGRRIIFWNNPTQDGAAGTVITYTANSGYSYRVAKASKAGHLYLTADSGGQPRIEIYDLPIHDYSTPIRTWTFPFPTIDPTSNDTLSGSGAFWGIAPTDDDAFLWVSNSAENRVFRLRNPLRDPNVGKPQVDLVLGQTSLTGTGCNNIPMPVTWTNPYNVAVQGNTITKNTNSGASWDAGAFSNEVLPPRAGYSSSDGSVYMTVDSTTTERAFGLNAQDTGPQIQDIDYGLQLSADGHLFAFDPSAGHRPPYNSVPVGTYSVGDVLEVARGADNVMRYYRNRATNPTPIYSYAEPDIFFPRVTLHMDTSITTFGGTVSNAFILGVKQPNTLCAPGALSLDHPLAGATPGTYDSYGNLYVADDAQEQEGNYRLLEFDKTVFPLTNTTVVYAPFPTKIFTDVAAWEPAFDKQNRMVMGYNHYVDGVYPGRDPYPVSNPDFVGRFAGLYEHPLAVGVQDPGKLLSDVYSWAYSAAFDANDNLYIGDPMRSRVLKYKQPGYGEPVMWIDRDNAIANRNFVQKSPDGVHEQWDSGAMSVMAIQSGDGYAQTTVDFNNTYRMFGLGHQGPARDYTKIDYAIFLQRGGTLAIYENGNFVSDVGSYSVGDILKVAIEGGKVFYYRNGRSLYNHSTTPIYPLRVHAALADANSTIANAYLGGPALSNLGAVQWTGASSNVQLIGNTLRKTGPTDMQWDAGAGSYKSIPGGYGYAQVTVDANDKYRTFGLSHANNVYTLNDIDFGIMLQGGGTLAIYEGATDVHDVPCAPGDWPCYRVGDVLSVVVDNNVVKYYQNGQLLWTSTHTPTYNLQFDSSIANLGTLRFDGHSQLYNAFIGGNLVNPPEKGNK